MTNAYQILRQKHQDEVDNFPMVFAFSNEQFEKAMNELGLTANDTDKVYSIGGGGLIRKTDSAALNEMFERHDKGLNEAIDGDSTGYGFIFDMFAYELANHEYGYTGDLEPTLDALGLTIDEVNASDQLLNGLKKARRLENEREMTM